MKVIETEMAWVYSNRFLLLLETGTGTTDAVFVLTDVRDTCVQGALTYGNRTMLYD